MSNVAEIVNRVVAFRPRASALGEGGRLLRGGSLTIADQVVASGTTFATGVLIGRICSKEEFGLYMLGFSVVTFLMTIQASLVSTPYMIYFPRTDEATRPRLTGSALLFQMVLAACAAVIIGVVAFGAWIFTSTPGMPSMLAALAAAILFLLLRDFIRQICFARLEVMHAFGFDVSVAGCQLLALGALAIVGWMNASSALIALGLACALGASGWYWTHRDSIQVHLPSAAADFSRAWVSGKWLFASGLVWSISMNLYAWLIVGFHGAASVGAWGVAVGTVTLLNPFMLGLQNYLGPHIMHAHTPNDMRSLARAVTSSTVLYAGSLLMFSVLMYLFGDQLVVAIYGSKYAGGGPVVAILSLNLVFLAIGFCVSRGLFAMEKASLDFRVNFVALATMIVLGVTLSRNYGPLGAALGQVATSATAAVVRTAVFAATLRRTRRALT
ncbi:MAG: oligosaccharide flippase family protein [Candidatus Hydrogenedentes bacterium]|nr:oligosaccharide flippase family protein [Candidatus Hydrogenedentota bacterium]